MEKKWKIGLVMAMLLAVLTSGFSATSSMFDVYWSVASSYDHTISYNANCSGGTAYFVEDDGAIDGNGWKLLPYDDASKSNACQSDSAAYFTVTITGTATSELDLNVTNAQGEDVNLKVFKSSSLIFCGDANCNGWEETCSVTDGAVTDSTCLQVGTSAGEFYSLASGASQGFCMCADFNASGTPVTLGDHAEEVGITSRAAD